MVCLVLELTDSWVVVGFGVGMEAIVWSFVWSLIPWCSVYSGVFWFSQVLGLSLLPLDFSFILPVVSRLLQLCSTGNKNFYVNGEKICHCEGPPKRFTGLHEE